MYQPARRAALLHSTETSPTADIITPQIPSIYDKVTTTIDLKEMLFLIHFNAQAWCQVG